MNSIINELNANSHIIVWTLITFSLLLVILGKWGWPAILGALEAREKGIQDDLDGARKARDEAERLLSEHKKALGETEAQIRAMMDEARKDARVLKEDIEHKSQEEAGRIRERSIRDIDQAKLAAVASLRQESVRLSALMASKILGRSVAAGDQTRLIDECVRELEATRGG